MNEGYATMKSIGKDFGTTSHQVGKWLTALGLRDNGHPTSKAFDQSFVTQCDSTQPGTYFYVWHRKRTTDALIRAGHKVAVSSPEPS